MGSQHLSTNPTPIKFLAWAKNYSQSKNGMNMNQTGRHWYGWNPWGNRLSGIGQCHHLQRWFNLANKFWQNQPQIHQMTLYYWWPHQLFWPSAVSVMNILDSNLIFALSLQRWWNISILMNFWMNATFSGHKSSKWYSSPVCCLQLYGKWPLLEVC